MKIGSTRTPLQSSWLNQKQCTMTTALFTLAPKVSPIDRARHWLSGRVDIVQEEHEKHEGSGQCEEDRVIRWNGIGEGEQIQRERYTTA